jgi:hypothetical protein
MIFRSVRKSAVHCHRTPWTVPKRYLEVTNLREPPPNVVDRHAVVVGLWWTRECRSEKILSDGPAYSEK